MFQWLIFNMILNHLKEAPTKGQLKKGIYTKQKGLQSQDKKPLSQKDVQKIFGDIHVGDIVRGQKCYSTGEISDKAFNGKVTNKDFDGTANWIEIGDVRLNDTDTFCRLQYHKQVGEVKESGTHEGLLKAWDKRGRTGKKEARKSWSNGELSEKQEKFVEEEIMDRLKNGKVISNTGFDHFHMTGVGSVKPELMDILKSNGTIKNLGNGHWGYSKLTSHTLPHEGRVGPVRTEFPAGPSPVGLRRNPRGDIEGDY